MVRSRALRGGGRACLSAPPMLLRAVEEAGPLTLTTATPHLPWPDDNAKMVSASHIGALPLQKDLPTLLRTEDWGLLQDVEEREERK
ncbi:hypothetical protein NHX12_032804 [Muraenolepis orangiensis]|uniref:Uncharacterized protein n=1 Tax=Muraenolepis orangiensis TaxID=630683 RepID=A0A9Q0II51_9TELE|nr:hypothetical protein NHX12_032804 [Muraenolepis orangiensis]